MTKRKFVTSLSDLEYQYAHQRIPLIISQTIVSAVEEQSATLSEIAKNVSAG